METEENIFIITDHEAVTKVSETVSKDEFIQITQKLLKVMMKNTTIAGLAAIQIGIPKNVFVMWEKKKKNRNILSFMNPTYEFISNDRFPNTEGCMSIPGKKFKVPRADHVVIKDDYNGITKLHFDNAIVAQHEMDHLFGMTIQEKGEEV
jgi:peptide deformylase